MDDEIRDRLVVTASVLVIIIAMKYLAKLIAPILFAMTLAILFWPVLEWLESKGLARWLSITIVATIGVIFIGGLIFMVVNSVQKLVVDVPSYVNLLDQRLSTDYDVNGLLNATGLTGENLSSQSINIASTLAASVFSIITFLFMLLLMIIASDSVVRRFKTLKNIRLQRHFLKWSRSIQVQYRVQTFSNLLSGFLTTMLFVVLGIPYALLWGVLAFMLAYIPNVGLVIASIPPVLLTFILDGWIAAIIVVAFITILNAIMDNLVTPRFMGREFDIPAVYIFISFVVSNYIFGVLGAFLYLPLFLAVRQLLLIHPETRSIGYMLGGK